MVEPTEKTLRRYPHNWTYKLSRNLSRIKSFPRPLRILEIGVWEARSAVWMLEHLQPAFYVGIDSWDLRTYAEWKYPHNATGEAMVRDIERRAYENLAPFPHAMLLRGRSQEILAGPDRGEVFRPESFGLVYIDGGHERDEVAADSRNVWPLVAPGGLVIWDDCWTKFQPPPDNPVLQAVEAFLPGKRYEVLFRGVQYGVRKL